MAVSKSQKVRNILSTNPDLKPSEVAKMARVKASLVYTVKNEMRKKAASGADVVAAFTSNRGRPRKAQTTKPSLVADMVNHPPHYTKGGIETLDFIKAKLSTDEYKGYLKGNLIKYISRAGLKDEEATDFGKINFYATELAGIK